MSLRMVGTAQDWARLATAVVVLMIGGGGAIPGTARAESGEDAKAATAPTYSADVAPILRERCLGCHRKGQVGPFGLETYEQARKRSADIAAVAEDRAMPPWKPTPGVGPKLKHDRSLTDAEIATLQAWAEAGAPRGDAAAEAPAPPAPDDATWALGTPDLVLEPAEDFHVPASGPDVYRCFVIPTNLPSDVYIEAVEYKPGNRKVVHHLSTFIDTRGGGRAMDAAEAGSGYTSFSGPGIPVYGELGFWTAGNAPNRLPDGVGFALPRGADVIVQVHYHPTGKPEADRTRVGLYFARKPIKQVFHWNDASNYAFKLPANQDNVEIKGSWCVPADLEALAVSPHMHDLGRDFKMWVEYPDGKTRDLIEVADWDPGWQDAYYFQEAVALPKGSIVRVLAHFNNADHPRNHSRPPREVKSGHAFDEEMCVGYIAVVKKGQDLTRRGARDDLYETFEKQRRQLIARKAQKRRR